MCINKYLTTKDIEFMEQFLLEHDYPAYNLTEYLRDWYEAKNEYLFKLFDDKLIIDCGEIELKKSNEEIFQDIIKDDKCCCLLAKLKETALRLAKKIIPYDNDCLHKLRCRNDEVNATDNEYFMAFLHSLNPTTLLYEPKVTKKLKIHFAAEDEKQNEYFYVHCNQKISKVLNSFCKTVEKIFPNQYTGEIAEIRVLINTVFSKFATYTAVKKNNR